MTLPLSDRLLLGPGPSPVSPRVMAALSAPPRSHLDPDLVALLDDIRARLTRVFRAADDYEVLAVSGTGSSGMETVVANLAEPGRQAVVVVNGYFGDRLASLLDQCQGLLVGLEFSSRLFDQGTEAEEENRNTRN